MSTKKNAAYNVAYRMFSVFLPLVTAPYLSRVAAAAIASAVREAVQPSSEGERTTC